MFSLLLTDLISDFYLLQNLAGNKISKNKGHPKSAITESKLIWHLNMRGKTLYLLLRQNATVMMALADNDYFFEIEIS